MTEETRGILIEPDEVPPAEMPSSSDSRHNLVSASTTAANPTVLVIIATVPETIMSFLIDQIRFLTENGFEVHTITSPGLNQMPGSDALNSVRHEIPMTALHEPVRRLRSPSSNSCASSANFAPPSSRRARPKPGCWA